MANLLEVLEEARARGLLGPGPLDEHIGHSRALAGLVGEPPRRFLDLGSGGGIPGLVLAAEWPAAAGVLLDAHRRAQAFLEEAIDRLGLAGRLRAVAGRAEELARDPELRSASDLVVARAFGPPPATAECGAGFLREGGRLVVSEPPEPDPARWDPEGLARLGLSAPAVRRGDGVTIAVMTLEHPVDDRWPRRTGIPSKRPCW